MNPSKKDFLAATRLLSAKIVDVSELISDRMSLDDLEAAFEKAILPDTYRIVVQPE